MIRFTVRFCIFSVIALLGLTGCGNNPYQPGETAGPVLFRAMGDDPRTLDPTVSYVAGVEAATVDAIYPSFYHYHFLKQSPFKLEPMLGAKEPERRVFPFKAKGKSGKGEAWRFELKKGVRFQDDPCFPGGKGREVVAADIIYAFRRMADPAIPCPVLGFFEDKILGFADYVKANRARQEKKQTADYKAPVEGLWLDPNNPHVFEIRLNQPYPQLKFLMAMHFTTPIAREAAEKYGKDLARHPVGCGPYILQEWTPKKRIVLTVNPNRMREYYPTEGEPGDREAGLLKDAGKLLPLNEKVVYTAMRESTTSWNMFVQGYLDAYAVTQENYSQVVSRAGQLTPEMEAKGITLTKVVDPGIAYLLFNMEDPVVGGYTPQKRKLRQAISLSLDAQAFLDLFSQGNGKLAQFLIPPGLFGYDENYKNPYRQYDPSLKRAKELLAEAGYPNGIDKKTGQKLTIYFDNAGVTAAGRQYAGLLVKQVSRLGIKVESRPSRPIVWQDRVDKGQFQFISYGWLADYPDPENFVFLLYGPNKRPGPNHTNYNNPEYNKLFEQMRAMEDSPARRALIEKMRAIAVEDCPMVFMDHGEDLALNYNWLQNAKIHPIANDVTQYRRVDGETRARLQSEWNRPLVWPLLVFIGLLFVSSIPAANTVKQRRTRRLRRDAAPGETDNAKSSPTEVK